MFLLRLKPLDLITNHVVNKKYNLNVSFISHFFIRRLSYHNKLAVITSIRSFSKILIMIFTSVFAATLVFLALLASGLVNDMLGSQFAGVNFNYQNTYQFSDNIRDNFFTNDNKLLYKFDSVGNIKYKPSLYGPLNNALEKFKKDHKLKQVIDFRDGYIIGSELLKIRRETIEPYFNQFPVDFQKFWNNNIILIDFLTNQNGQSSNDLMLSFGLVPYEKNQEVG